MENLMKIKIEENFKHPYKLIEIRINLKILKIQIILNNIFKN
jgi:hypothetical protein